MNPASSKTVGLHYIAFSKSAINKARLSSIELRKKPEMISFVTNFG
jgi:hypothetical protein